MRIVVTKRFDFEHRSPATARAPRGTLLGMTALTPGDEPQVVKKEVGEAAIAAGTATNVGGDADESEPETQAEQGRGRRARA